MAAAITAREFKLLLKPELFPTKKAVIAFNERLTKIAADAGVRYEPFDRIDSEMRGVQFFDTPDCVFRDNRVILRLRRDASSGFPDETYEVTFKLRSPDFRASADFNVDSTMKEISIKKKFKEEILRGNKQGTIKSIFSNNLIGYYPVAKFEHPLSEIMEIFPGLKALNLDGTKMVSAVNGARVLEVGAVWAFTTLEEHLGPRRPRRVDAPGDGQVRRLVAEFGWSYHMQGDGSKQKKAHKAADSFSRISRNRFGTTFLQAQPRPR